MRLAAALGALIAAAPLAAHDLITAEAATRCLQDADRWLAAPRQADARYRLGAMLEEIRVLLNQDIAAHGKVQGLPSNYLVEELARRGAPLHYSQVRRRYIFIDTWFAEALRLDPRHADAGFRLLQGRFQESYDEDPLVWHGDGLASEIALAEDLLAREPTHERREEIEFIAAILYTRAARAGSAAYAAKARQAIAEFEQRYPGSLRTAAMPVLREAIKIAK
jgi:hypothetical protein